jgi:hypothetical protein
MFETNSKYEDESQSKEPVDLQILLKLKNIFSITAILIVPSVCLSMGIYCGGQNAGWSLIEKWHRLVRMFPT